jgi:hypothetical protein
MAGNLIEKRESKEAKPDWRRIMMLEMPRYELKYHGEDGWQEISELKVIDELFKTFKMVTPVIQQMIEGKQVVTTEAVYRLKGKSKFSEVYI